MIVSLTCFAVCEGVLTWSEMTLWWHLHILVVFQEFHHLLLVASSWRFACISFQNNCSGHWWFTCFHPWFMTLKISKRSTSHHLTIQKLFSFHLTRTISNINFLYSFQTKRCFHPPIKCIRLLSSSNKSFKSFSSKFLMKSHALHSLHKNHNFRNHLRAHYKNHNFRKHLRAHLQKKTFRKIKAP